MYKLTIAYDGNAPIITETYSDALTAVNSFNKCSDFGDAKEYATYNLSEPSGKMHTKIFYTNGNVGGK